MACFPIARSGLTPAIPRRSGPLNRRFAVITCRVQEDSDSSNGEEAPESLFMKELKKRGMMPTSLLEEGKRGGELEEKEKVETKEGDGWGKNEKEKKKRRNELISEYDKGVEDQRERSMALNSEGLEGLIPRAKLLLTLGGTFFLAFWPLILVTIALFAALCFYFGPTFVHNTSKTPTLPPPYVDPYALLEDERISQIAPRLN